MSDAGAAFGLLVGVSEGQAGTPRGVPGRFALTTPAVWPSAYLHGVGTPEWPLLSQWCMEFAAQYPACTFPCQRFATAQADGHA